MADLRLDANFFDNVKTQQLQRRLGDAGVLAVLRLWCYVRKFRPTGELTGMNAEKIAIATRWEGDEDELIRALSELIFIERSDDGQWRIHDWTAVNEWAAGTEGRRNHAKKLNHRRWYEQKGVPCGDPQCAVCAPLRSNPPKTGSELNQSGIRTDSVKDSSSRNVKRKARREITQSLRQVGDLWNAIAGEWKRAMITDEHLLKLTAAIVSTESDLRGEDPEFSWEALFTRTREQASFLRDQFGGFNLAWLVATKRGERNALKVWRRQYRSVYPQSTLTKFPTVVRMERQPRAGS